MASFVGHFAAGFTIAKILDKKASIALIVLSLISSWLPDIDVLGFHFGIAYGDFWGHRGFTHSILFALIWATLVCFFFKSTARPLVWLILFLSTISHGVLDAMTSGGMGIAFFSPLDDSRYFLPWRPIKVSPLSAASFLGESGKRVVLSELKWVVLPCLVLLLSSWILGKK